MNKLKISWINCSRWQHRMYEGTTRFDSLLFQVVIGKLRSDTTVETNDTNRRALKALGIIFPLLGLTYLVTMFPPVNPDGIGYHIFQTFRAILLSTQVKQIEIGFYTYLYVLHMFTQPSCIKRLDRKEAPFAFQVE